VKLRKHVIVNLPIGLAVLSGSVEVLGSLEDKPENPEEKMSNIIMYFQYFKYLNWKSHNKTFINSLKYTTR